MADQEPVETPAAALNFVLVPPLNGIEAIEVASYKDCVYWTKRAVEMEKLLRSLKESKIRLDQAKREIAERKKRILEQPREINPPEGIKGANPTATNNSPSA